QRAHQARLVLAHPIARRPRERQHADHLAADADRYGHERARALHLAPEREVARRIAHVRDEHRAPGLEHLAGRALARLDLAPEDLLRRLEAPRRADRELAARVLEQDGD